MRQYETFELTFQGSLLTENWAAADVTAAFTHEGNTVTVPGFYDGDGCYKVRFLPEDPGTYTWHVTGAVQGEGTEICTPADGTHHGRIVPDGTTFRYADGTKYLPFGTTVYALAHQPDTRVKQTLETLKNAPFNKVRMCVFPKHYDFNHNEPPVYPFEKNDDGTWDVGRPCIAFWHRFEAILGKLEDLGIQIDLILFHPYDRWGFSNLGMERNFEYLGYVERRLAAWPNIWWSLANEYDLMLPTYSMEDWYAIEEFVAAHDPYRHMLSNHNCVKFYDFSRPNVTHVCLQNAPIEKASVFAAKFGKPVLYDEMCYEGNISMNWGNLSAFEMVNRFWCVCALGAYGTHGETYLSDDDILWWAAGGVLKGESPVRIAWLKDILESLPGPLSSDPVHEIPHEILDDPEKLKAMMANASEEQRLFGLILSMLTPAERETFMSKQAGYYGHYKDEAYLWYFARTAPGITTVTLPDTHKYRIEVLDAWEMKRTVAAENVSGTVTVKLLSKEGEAVLATAM